MNKQDRQSNSGSMRPVPVRQAFSSRMVACYEANRTEGKKRKNADEREAVEVEAQPLELQVGQKIDNTNALLLGQ